MLRLSLLLLQKVDNESLVFHDEVIGEAFCLQVVAKMVAPFGVERLEHGEL